MIDMKIMLFVVCLPLHLAQYAPETTSPIVAASYGQSTPAVVFRKKCRPKAIRTLTTTAPATTPPCTKKVSAMQTVAPKYITPKSLVSIEIVGQPIPLAVQTPEAVVKSLQPIQTPQPIQTLAPTKIPQAVQTPPPAKTPEPTPSINQLNQINIRPTAQSSIAQSKQALGKLINALPTTPTADFQGDCISLHNKFRSILGLSPFTFSSAANAVAQKVAKNLASRNAFEHSHTPGFGENLFKISIGGSHSCATAVFAWINEFNEYNGEPIGQGPFEAYGHFTQCAWPETKSMACAAAVGSDGGQTVVCEYSPPGNFNGRSIDIKIGSTSLR